MHYYSHHIGDFLKATSSLSDSDKMSYLKLMWTYYDTERPLPNDPEMLAFQIGSTREKVLIILQSYFYLEDNFWRHSRCDEELAKVYKNSETAREKARKRWEKAAAMQQHKQQHQEHVDLHNAFGELLESSSNATAMPQHSHSNAPEPKNDATHIPINPIIKPPIPPKGGSAISLNAYLKICKDEGKKAIPEGHAVFAYAEKVGIPHEFLKLQWLEFKNRYSLEGAKRYKAWPTVFLKSVQGNWFKLWYATDDGYALTTVGLQAKKLHKEAA